MSEEPAGNPPDSDRLSSYDYELPTELIAAEPPVHRGSSRLMVCDRVTGMLQHRQFSELPRLLSPGDLLVINETKVIPARLTGYRQQTGGRWEGLFLGCTATGLWRLIGQTRGRLVPGESILLTPPESAAMPGSSSHHGQSRSAGGPVWELRLVTKEADGTWQAESVVAADPLLVLEQYGDVPLPPYIRKGIANAADRERYQTVFARRPGAVAAPTAGLHFTPELFDECRRRGIDIAAVTLHVGIGTFRPVTVESLPDHVMHAEWCELSAETVANIEATRERGGRVVAVGTTSLRTLESAAWSAEMANADSTALTGTSLASAPGQGETATKAALQPFVGETRLFIRPPYRFRVVDALITNFHLPKSTLLVLVSAFASREIVQRAYAAAVAERYRFFSYGDAMLFETQPGSRT